MIKDRFEVNWLQRLKIYKTHGVSAVNVIIIQIGTWYTVCSKILHRLFYLNDYC